MAELGAALTQAGPGYRDHMDWNDATSWWMVGMMFLFGIAVLGLIVWAVVTTTRATHTSTGPGAGLAPPAGRSARAILDERFARGQIDAAEYAERKQLLG